MSVIIPQFPAPDTSSAELKLRDKLTALSDDWTVLHNVAWQSLRHGKPGDGQADFVLVNRHHGLLVVEVKGGGIRVDRGDWFSVDRYGVEHSIRNPFEQATSSKHALVKYLKQHGVSTLPAGHVVAFPDISEIHPLGAAAPPQIVWTGSDLRDIEGALKQACSHWDLTRAIPQEFASRIRTQLAPTLVARPLLRDFVVEAGEALLRLTDEQILVMRGLRRNRRAIVFGRAGTGKSVLAVEETRRLISEGFRVLLCCFNAPLAETLAATLSDLGDGSRLTVGTFHAVCREEARRAGMPVPTSPSQTWWDEEGPALLPEAVRVTGRKFDAIVVDEGQDFDASWWVALQLALVDPDDGPFYVFADAQQAIYRPDWQPPFAQPAFDLEINCRNTLPIARKVSAVFGDTCSTLGTEGIEPKFREAENMRSMGETIRAVLEELLEEQKLLPEQVAVLAGRRDIVDVLLNQEVAGQRLVRPGAAGVVVETVHRYKGLEADAVLLVFGNYDQRRDDTLLYIGMSRARAYLEVIGPRSLRERLGWETAA